MIKKLAGTVAVIAVVAVPTSLALGDGGSGGGDAQARAGGRGHLVAKDTAKRRPAAAVARVTLKKFGKVSYVISSKPGHLPVDWAFTTRCTKGFLIDYYPGPGDVHTTTKKTTIAGTFKIPLSDPDECTFAAAGQIAKNKLGKTVSVKIYNK
jgi:hypothetical protein